MNLSQEILNLKLEGSDSKKHSINDIKTDYIVIYFYPADNTPLCTIQGRNYTKLLPEFEKLNCTIVGISAGSGKSKCGFATNQNYKHLLLADTNYQVAKYFDVYSEDGLPKYPDLKIFRCTFVLNKEKKIIREFRYVDANSDAQKSLEFIKSIT